MNKSYARNNHAKFIKKIFRKAIKNSSRLLNRYGKKKPDTTTFPYKRQRKACLKLLRKNRKEFYTTPNVKYMTKNKPFWKTVKASFRAKTLKNEKVNLVKTNGVISDESKLVKVFSKYFRNIIQNLVIDRLIVV